MDQWREWIFAMIGTVVFIIGIIVRVKTLKKGRKCTESVSAQIVEIREHERTTENDNGKTHTDIYYHPVYQFTVRGKEYKVWSQYGSGRSRRFRLGNMETIRYDPENPKEIYTKLAKKADRQFSFFLMFVGLLLIGVNILAVYKAV